MAKSFNRVLTGELVVPGAQRTTLVNTGVTPIFVVDSETDGALKTLEYEEEMIVKHALFAIKPGGSQKLAAGTYFVDFADSISASAIMLVEQSEPKTKKSDAPVV